MSGAPIPLAGTPVPDGILCAPGFTAQGGVCVQTSDTCCAYFHYERDANGVIVPGGIWVLGIQGTCLTSFAHDFGFGGNGFFAFPKTDPVEAIIEELEGINDPSNPSALMFTITAFATALYDQGATVITAAQGPADDFDIVGCPSPCPQGSFYDPRAEQCVSSQIAPCIIPCWLSCAPAAVQGAYCSFVQLVNQTCSFSGLAECLAVLGAEEFNPDAFALCALELTAACGASIIGGLINSIIGWVGLNPFGCPGCTNAPPPQCPAGQYPPPCNRHPGDTLMADSGCCDPPGDAPALTPLQRSGAMTAVLSLPIPTRSLAPTACGGCSRPADTELEELEEEF